MTFLKKEPGPKEVPVEEGLVIIRGVQDPYLIP